METRGISSFQLPAPKSLLPKLLHYCAFYIAPRAENAALILPRGGDVDGFTSVGFVKGYGVGRFARCVVVCQVVLQFP
jgi:hypothetical protein